MDREIGISTASKLLGISTSTLKRLCDENLIPSIRTPGGHRRFDRAEVELVGQRLVGQSMRLAADCPTDLGDKIAFLLATAQERGLDDLFQEQLATGQSLPNLFDLYLIPALKELLTDAQVTMPVKLLAQHSIVRVVDRLSVVDASKWSETPVALGGSVGEPADGIASKLVEATLRSVRIHGNHLESGVDVEHLAKSAEQLQARTVWLAQLVDHTSHQLQSRGQELRRLLPSHIRVILFSGSPMDRTDNSPDDLPIYHSLATLFLREGPKPDRMI